MTDHALVRLLSRSGIDVESIRAATEDALATAHGAALAVGGGADHLITVNGACFVVRNGAVTTVLEPMHEGERAYALVRPEQ